MIGIAIGRGAVGIGVIVRVRGSRVRRRAGLGRSVALMIGIVTGHAAVGTATADGMHPKVTGEARATTGVAPAAGIGMRSVVTIGGPPLGATTEARAAIGPGATVTAPDRTVVGNSREGGVSDRIDVAPPALGTTARTGTAQARAHGIGAHGPRGVARDSRRTVPRTAARPVGTTTTMRGTPAAVVATVTTTGDTAPIAGTGRTPVTVRRAAIVTSGHPGIAAMTTVRTRVRTEAGGHRRGTQTAPTVIGPTADRTGEIRGGTTPAGAGATSETARHLVGVPAAEIKTRNSRPGHATTGSIGPRAGAAMGRTRAPTTGALPTSPVEAPPIGRLNDAPPTEESTGIVAAPMIVVTRITVAAPTTITPTTATPTTATRTIAEPSTARPSPIDARTADGPAPTSVLI